MTTVIGHVLNRLRDIGVDDILGVPRDCSFPVTVLLLILIAFTIEYSFGMIAAIAPDRLADPSFRVLDPTLAGIFVGKLAHYLARYFGKPATVQADTERASAFFASDRKH